MNQHQHPGPGPGPGHGGADPTGDELPRVLAALGAVYAPTTAAAGGDGHGGTMRRDEADAYLTSFQRRPSAWSVCDRLLSPDSDAPAAGIGAGGDAASAAAMAASTQRRFFAAQTLHAKILRDAAELPPSSLHGLRDSLLGHLVHHASSPSSGGRPLVTRLCMAIAALAAQTG